jgi:hypothetical protein
MCVGHSRICIIFGVNVYSCVKTWLSLHRQNVNCLLGLLGESDAFGCSCFLFRAEHM